MSDIEVFVSVSSPVSVVVVVVVVIVAAAVVVIAAMVAGTVFAVAVPTPLIPSFAALSTPAPSYAP